MGMNRHHRRLAAWIACFAVLLASLAPSISHAVNAARLAAQAARYADVHALNEDHGAPSEQGASSTRHMHHVHPMPDMHAVHAHASHRHEAQADQAQADEAQTQDATAPDAQAHVPASHPPSHSSGLHFEHCPFCFTHAGSFGLAHTAQLPAPCAPAVSAAPLLFYQAPDPLFIWIAARPRGPPAAS